MPRAPIAQHKELAHVVRTQVTVISSRCSSARSSSSPRAIFSAHAKPAAGSGRPTSSSARWSTPSAAASRRSGSSAAITSPSSPTTASSGRSPTSPATASAPASCRCTRPSSPKSGPSSARIASAVAIIAATEEIAAKCKEIPKTAPVAQARHRHVDADEADPHSFQALLEIGRKNPVPSIKPDAKDTACLIYTSGTTGNPKGVILSHGNIASNVNAIHELLPLAPDDRSLSFLPWAHSFGHTCELQAMLSIGGSLALCDDVSKIIDYLAEVQPTVLFSVPRIFNRIYDGVGKQMAGKPKAVRALFHGGLKAAAKEAATESR